MTGKPLPQLMLDDVRFILRDVLGETETYDDVLAGAAELCRDVIAPLNAPGDLAGRRLARRHRARRPPASARRSARSPSGGWVGLTADAGARRLAALPHLVGAVLEELLCAANLSFSTYAGLTSGAYRAVALHGDEEQRARLLPPLAPGHVDRHDVPDRGTRRHRPRPDPHPRRAGRRTAATASPARRSSSPPASTT